jgi:hypothetical protein
VIEAYLGSAAAELDPAGGPRGAGA